MMRVFITYLKPFSVGVLVFLLIKLVGCTALYGFGSYAIGLAVGDTFTFVAGALIFAAAAEWAEEIEGGKNGNTN